ncbi:MAG: glycoside-pentoside-hexuronide (GPH):cation symporter [Veillonellaceae bacterium]|nr:glycoside-pentoside-hexuronide (GPH):cation symporter [Veillonellaceae bacterium]MDY4484597.1 glycoside-pentoside-hexuronide (GPH):cation symporter [Anaerovibrio sp.]MCI7091454.1 glycoside-pentoside-hexuronide (GPH):cation symporter [Veillonellaceae bacterium]MCI7266427.1 glycoside-pentoside-hexuronide (GPH):cation symporter [Veillonellaceae bacterium]MDD6562949.1 glycoside-pentoside-hexuronide (GPH):cation symporter [Veillonellaceae bacterium]
MSNGKNRIWQRIAYACGTFGHDVFYAMIGTYFMIFVTSNLFNSDNPTNDAYMIGIVTTIILVLRIAELFVDPFIGNIIDKTKTRWGRFKPWVLGGAVIAAVTLAILFTDFGGLTVSNPTLYLIIFAIVYFIMDIFYSAKDVAIWSMIPALSFDSHEREVTATVARIGSVFGGQMVTVIVMPVVLYFSVNQNGGAGDPTGWFAFACIGGGIATLGAIILGLGTHEQDNALRENKEETSAKDVLKVLTKNDQLLWMAIAYLVYGIGINIVNNFNLYYFIYVIGDATKFSILGVINTVIGLLAVAAFPILTTKFSRRKLFFSSIAVMTAALVLYAMSGTNVTLALIGAGLFTLPQALIFLVVLMTITDSVEYGQLKLGHRDEAVCLCVRPLVDKFAGAVSSGIIGLAAIWVGMTGGASASGLTADNMMRLQMIMFASPIVLMVIGALIYRAKVTLTEQEHARIVEELEEKWESMNK